MTHDFFTDMLIGGVIFTLMGLPIFHRDRNGERIRYPHRLRDMTTDQSMAYVSFVAWYIGRVMLVIGAVGYLATLSAR